MSKLQKVSAEVAVDKNSEGDSSICSDGAHNSSAEAHRLSTRYDSEKEVAAHTVVISSSDAAQSGERLETGGVFSRGTTDIPRIADKLSWAVIMVVLIGGAERFCYYAVSTPWQNYIQNPPDGSYSLPGALGLGQSRATSINNAYMVFTFLTPMPMALVSDLYWGRYKTLLVSLLVYAVGTLIQFVTSLPGPLSDGAGVGGLAASMILIGIGQGGVKATFSPFLGDQCLTKEPGNIVQKNGKLVLIDRGRTLQLVYNLFYWATNIASLSSVPATFLERIFGFWTAFLLAFISLWVSIILLVLSHRRLVIVPPQGNILLPAGRVIACAARHGFKLDHAKSNHQIALYGRAGGWSDEFVDDIRMTLRTSRVLLSFTVFYLCINQMYTNLISQAGQMRLGGVPNDMIQAIAGVACVILGPAIQAMYGALASRHIVPGSMFLITLAFVLCAGAMAYAAGTQQLIYTSGPCYNSPLACAASDNGRIPNNVSVWAQTPVYFIFAAAEIFGFVTASEYTYTHSPKQAKSIVQALTQWAACLGSVLGLAVSPVAKDPDLVIYYSSLAAVMVVSAVGFWSVFGHFDRDDKIARREKEEKERVEELKETREGENVDPAVVVCKVAPT